MVFASRSQRCVDIIRTNSTYTGHKKWTKGGKIKEIASYATAADASNTKFGMSEINAAHNEVKSPQKIERHSAERAPTENNSKRFHDAGINVVSIAYISSKKKIVS